MQTPGAVLHVGVLGVLLLAASLIRGGQGAPGLRLQHPRRPHVWLRREFWRHRRRPGGVVLVTIWPLNRGSFAYAERAETDGAGSFAGLRGS